jgi:NAD(P)-dependent dehydrogenase (short-subunit alcohol dehydrogenase family)
MTATTHSILTAIVVGATGAVGAGIVDALLSFGWQVHAIGRDQKKLSILQENVLKEYQQRLHCHAQHGFNAVEMARVRARVLEISPRLQLVIASLGGWKQGGKMVEVDVAQWSAVMRDNLDSHWLCAKQWLPALEQDANAAYVLINGGAALVPVPGAGPVSVAAGAQLSLKAVLAQESYPQGPRVYSVLANTPVITRARPQVQKAWLSTEDIARGCIECFEDQAATKHGATLVLGRKTNEILMKSWKI